MKKSNDQSKTWYKLDLSANVYPTLQRRNFSNVFRLSVVLKENIDADLLQKAVDMTLPRFPAFKVALRKGVFWRYLEPNNRPGPFVMPDIVNPCMPLLFKSNNRYLIRIYYYQNKISLEMFHSLSDGNGALFLLKTITAVYLRLQGCDIPDGSGVLNIQEKPDPEELEDAYLRYASSQVTRPRSQGKAYRIRGHREPFYTLNIIHGLLSTDEVLQKAHDYGVSVTEYLNAVMLWALLEKQKSDKVFRQKPVTLALPVNLRSFFPSKTLRNFISMVYPSIDPRMGDYTFEEIVTQVHHYMRYYINNKFLNADITTNTAILQKPFVRIAPLFLKDIVVRQFYIRVQDRQSTAGLTNLGVVQIPDEMRPYIERFDALMGQPFSPRTNCAIISCGNILSISFSSSIIETDVERYFFRKLVKDGLHVKIDTNRNMDMEE
ncbi:MAG: alcohol acetyltransferase [Coprococcus sp.]